MEWRFHMVKSNRKKWEVRFKKCFQLFGKYFFSASYKLNALPGTEDLAVTKTKNPALMKLQF